MVCRAFYCTGYIVAGMGRYYGSLVFYKKDQTIAGKKIMSKLFCGVV